MSNKPKTFSQRIRNSPIRSITRRIKLKSSYPEPGYDYGVKTMTNQEPECCNGEPGSSETYANQVCMPLNGKVRCIDKCIHQIVAALNAGGVETAACCCGHGKRDGSIVLVDGRELVIREYNPTTSEGAE